MWNLTKADPKRIASQFHTGNLLAMLLENSGIDDAKIQDLLNADSTVHTSEAPCVKQACQRIIQAQKNQEKIFVGGDYDADGICATAIMKKTLDVLHIQNGYYIPDRFKEGYGLSARTVELAHQKGYSIIMTVDNGVRAHEALIKAKELGMYVIVTDHHRMEEEVEADIIVHPDFMEPSYSGLCGAGVALQISRTLIGNDDDLTAMAAVASIGDVMPLWDETRRIVLKGLDILKRRRPRPLYAMLRAGSAVNWNSVAFQIVPKLNSVGRMNDISNVNTLVPYLLLKDEAAITRYALQLEHVNELRKQLSDTQSKTAQEMMGDDAIELIFDAGFHEGICGLVAGRLANSCGKPVIVMTESGGLIKGSGRSVSGFDLFAFLNDFEEPSAFGGHEQAVGISVPKELFESFRAHLKEKAEKENLSIEEPQDTAIEIRADDISMDEILCLEDASPLPKEINPVFAVTDAQVLTVKETDKVIRYTVASANGNFEAVLYKRKGITPPEDPHVIIGPLSLNRWRSNVTMTMEIEDIY